MSEKTLLKIEGMSCQHCVSAVEGALRSVSGVKKVEVDLKKGVAKIEHGIEASVQDMKDAVVEAGFSVD